MVSPANLQIVVSSLQDIVQAFNGLMKTVSGASEAIWTSFAAIATPFANPLALDLSTGFNFDVTLTDNTVIDNPTNAKSGQSGALYLTQDATGGRTATFGSSWKWAAGSAPTLTATPNALDVIQYRVRSPDFIVGTFIGDVR